MADEIVDVFTETSTQSWGSRILGSIKGVLIGLVLVAASAGGLFWNEGRAVTTARSLTEGAGLVASVSSTTIDARNDGKLVHVSGEVKTSAPLADPEFGVTAPALRLVRVAEMYQWKEETKTETRKNLGGSEETITTYSYHQTWDDHRIDSSRFRRSGHNNPRMRYQRLEASARDATLGAFRPSETVLSQLSANDELRVDAARSDDIRRRVGQSAQVIDGRIFVGSDPQSPRIGDQRISYRIMPAGPVSIIGRQSGSDFAPFQTEAGDRLLMVRAGSLTADEMFRAAQRENTIFTWIIRAIGALFMFVGFTMVFRPLVVVADVVPIFGSILGAGVSFVAGMLTLVVAPVVIAIAWFWYRPFVSVMVLLGGAVAAFAIAKFAPKKRALASAVGSGALPGAAP